MVFTCTGDLDLTKTLPQSTGLLYSISKVAVNQTVSDTDLLKCLFVFACADPTCIKHFLSDPSDF